MPHFYFNVHDGKRYDDPDGADLPDLRAAQREAVVYAGQLLSSEPEAILNGKEWTMTVTDDAGLALFTLAFHAAILPTTKGGAGG